MNSGMNGSTVMAAGLSQFYQPVAVSSHAVQSCRGAYTLRAFQVTYMGVHVEMTFAWLSTHDAETLALNQLDPRLYAMNACANIMLLTSTAVVF